MAVLRPLRIVIDNYPDNQVEEFDWPLITPRMKAHGITEGAILQDSLYRTG